MSGRTVSLVDIDVSVNKHGPMHATATRAPSLISAPIPPIPPAAHAALPGADLAGSTAEALVVIVAPCNGRFRPVLSHGRAAAGALVGHVTGGRGRAEEVHLPAAATIQGLLALPGHLVIRGQALAWARRTQPEPAV